MAKKKQLAFLLQKDQKPIVDELTDEEAGIIFKAIYEYEDTKKEPKLEKTLRIVFKQFKVKLDLYDDAYEEKCLKNKKNIEKYWSEIKDTTEYDRIQSNTMATNKRKENKIKENKSKENERVSDKQIYSNTIIPQNTPTLSELRSFCQENDMEEFDCEYFYDHYEANGWTNGNGSKIKDWQAKVKKWYKDDLKSGKIKKYDTSRRLD